MDETMMNNLNLFINDYARARHSIFFVPFAKTGHGGTDGPLYEHCGLEWRLGVDCSNADLDIEIVDFLTFDHINNEWKVSEGEVFQAALANAERECSKNMVVHTIKPKNEGLEFGWVTIEGWSLPSRNLSMLWAESFGKQLLEAVGEPCWLLTLSGQGLYFLKDSELKRVGMEVSEAEAYIQGLRKSEEYLGGPVLFLSNDGKITPERERS